MLILSHPALAISAAMAICHPSTNNAPLDNAYKFIAMLIERFQIDMQVHDNAGNLRIQKDKILPTKEASERCKIKFYYLKFDMKVLAADFSDAQFIKQDRQFVRFMQGNGTEYRFILANDEMAPRVAHAMTVIHQACDPLNETGY